MRRYWDRVDFGHSCDLARFEQAAGFRYIRLNDAECFLFQKRTIAVAAIDILAGRNGNPCGIAHPYHGVDIIAGDWLLHPDQAEWLHQVTKLDGCLDVVTCMAFKGEVVAVAC